MKEIRKVISMCKQCDDYHTNRTYMGDEEYHIILYCAHGEEDRDMDENDNTETGFPEWCPLPDAGEGGE